MTLHPLPANPRVLVVVLRRLGDVLLTTPLIRSIKRAFPGGSIEALVFAGTEGILAGNPDLAGVIAISHQAGARDGLALLRRLRGGYDLAISTQTGDRPTTLAWLAGRQSVGLLDARGWSAAIKRLALSRSCASEPQRHRVLENLRLAEALGIPAFAELVCPAGAVRPGLMPTQAYAVVHAAPMFRYKRWRIEGWRALVAALRERGIGAVACGGKSDRAYLDEVWRGCEITRLDGALEWPELAALIGGARVYIGPDTAVTHLAAATGTATVSLYGPSDPQVWGPWPVGGLDRPWSSAGTIQQRGNVWLVQNPLPCLPCRQEGCERRLDSYSQCLDELSVAQVTSAVDQALALRRAA
jgi:heptosyltransferase III